MPNRRLTRKTIKGKDGVHPGSRKGKLSTALYDLKADKVADQLARVSLREHKLKGASKARRELASSKCSYCPLLILGLQLISQYSARFSSYMPSLRLIHYHSPRSKRLLWMYSLQGTTHV